MNDKSQDKGEPTRVRNEAYRWLDEYGDVLFKFARLRVSSSDVAEDLVQETFCLAIKAYDGLRNPGSVKAWLFQILRNEINNHYRKAARARKYEESTQPTSLSELLTSRLEPEEFRTGIEREEFWDVIQNCFEKVPEHLLETFLFRLANPDEKIEELCDQLKLTSSNFSVRLFRTRLMLRKCLEQNWFEQ